MKRFQATWAPTPLGSPPPPAPPSVPQTSLDPVHQTTCPGPPSTRPPKISRCFSSPAPIFALFFRFRGGLLIELWRVGAMDLCVWPLGRRGCHRMTPEKPKTHKLKSPWSRPAATIPREDPPRAKTRAKMETGGETSAKFWASDSSAPTFSGCGPLPLHPSRTPCPGPPSAGLISMLNTRVQKVDQLLINMLIVGKINLLINY